MIYQLENAFTESGFLGCSPLMDSQTIKSTNGFYMKLFGTDLFLASPIFQMNKNVYELYKYMPKMYFNELDLSGNAYFGFGFKDRSLMIYITTFMPAAHENIQARTDIMVFIVEKQSYLQFYNFINNCIYNVKH